METLIVILVVLAVVAGGGWYGYTLWRRHEADLKRELAPDYEPVDLYAELDGWEVRRVDREREAVAEDEPLGPARAGDDVDVAGLEGLHAEPEDHPPRQPAPAPKRPAAPRPRPAPPAPKATSRQRPAADAAAPAPPREDLIIALSLVAPADDPFRGPDLLAAFDAVGLVHGDMSIYHHFGMDGSASRIPVFSVASIVEPGTFDPAAMDDFTTRGLAMFMQLPGPVDGQVGLELMLNTGQRLKDALGGELRDERRSVLTQQTIAHLRERIAEFNRRRLVPSA